MIGTNISDITPQQVKDDVKELVDLFETLSTKIDPALAADFVCGELKRVLNYNTMLYKDSKLSVDQIVELLNLF